MAVKLAPQARLQYVDSSGNPYSGAKLFFYAAGTTTKQNTYTTSVGDTANTNPIELDSSGRTPYGVWLTEGVNYKVVLAPAGDTDPPTSPIFTEDVITGVNDNSDATNQWAASGVTPTYVSATQFTVPGDKTSTFPVDRRIKATVTAGTVYGYVSAVAYTTLTTVTVVLDSGSLDSGLSAVQVGILTDLISALPLTVAKRNAANNYTNAQNEAKGADIASAATINLTTATGNLVHVTGTTTITAITLASGAERTVVFDGSLTLTHNATTLILPDGANIQTAAGDKAVFRGDGSGNTRCISYERAVRKGSDVASAATVNLDAATGDFVHITGTTTITAITFASGRECDVVFDGALTLTHNATTLILPSGANITTAAGDRATFRGDGSGNTRCIHYTKATGEAVVGASITRSARTSNTILAASDKGALIEFTSGTFSQTFTAAATLTNGWYVYLFNSGTGDITLAPGGSEQIDGLTSFILYPGEARLVTCTGTAFESVLLSPGSRIFTASGTFTSPPGVSGYRVEVIAGGGGGGSGRRGAAGGDRAGGGGGGGGARIVVPISAIAAGTAVTVTVGAGGTGGAAITADATNGNNGTAGGNSSFGSYATAYGGGLGGGGGTGGSAGGGGGGGAGAGANSSVDGASAAGGLPQQTGFGAATSGNSGSIGTGGAANVSVGNTGSSAEWGGGSGGPSAGAGNIGRAAGSSIFGGPGGGGGGGLDSANTERVGGAGGNTGTWASGGGGAGGAITGGNGTAGTASTTGCGTGGGGGGSRAAAGAGGTGGAGGAPGGGGGGGGASVNGQASGAGGDGGRGEVRVYWW